MKRILLALAAVALAATAADALTPRQKALLSGSVQHGGTILTESGGNLVTEAGDKLVTER